MDADPSRLGISTGVVRTESSSGASSISGRLSPRHSGYVSSVPTTPQHLAQPSQDGDIQTGEQSLDDTDGEPLVRVFTESGSLGPNDLGS